MSTPPIAMELRGIRKQFGAVLANDDISFELRRQEVHALLGENGAGKSTLMNILYGLYKPDAGTISVNGKQVDIRNPNDAIAHGICMVHQHFMLVNTLTVLENIILGTKLDPCRIDMTAAEASVSKLCEDFQLNIPLHTKVGELPVGTQQKVELLKALYRKADILIMDEPTAVLTPQEVDDLFAILKNFVIMGKSIIFISHKLWEIMRIADRVTILRAGKSITTLDKDSTTKEELAEIMVGRKIQTSYDKAQVSVGDTLVCFDTVSTTPKPGVPTLEDVSFCLNRGEIVGIAGVDGNGQTTLAEVLMGLCPLSRGKVMLQGTDITGMSTRERIRKNVAHIPADRLRQGMMADFSIAENLVLDNFEEAPVTERGLFMPTAVLERGERLVKEFDVRPPDPTLHCGQLSGGNQQKVVFARELDKDPTVVIAAQPTRGLDIGATEFVHGKLLEQRATGHGVLLISADLDEILLLADRILVMFHGRIAGEVHGPNYDIREIGLLMGGVA